MAIRVFWRGCLIGMVDMEGAATNARSEEDSPYRQGIISQCPRDGRRAGQYLLAHCSKFIIVAFGTL